MICACSESNSGRYLRRIDLRLDKTEQSRVSKGFDFKSVLARQATETKEKNTPKLERKINRADFEALKTSTIGKSLSHADISRRYMNSVVLVKSEESSGTAFVVGSRGYLLTCAHVIPDEGKITVTYLKDKKAIDVEASLIHIDPDRDLALLKISPTGPLTCVTLEKDDESVSAGDAVTVIGNPGLGNAILTHTVTTGVVSSVNREIEGQNFVQTSAVVNAGNSGGPIFGPSGNVLGLVVLKARIEATAFAVPVSVLRQFLNGVIDAGN